MRRAAFLRLFLPFAALVAPLTASAAAEVQNLYAARVEVADKGENVRRGAFGAALLEVVIKVSGSRGASANTVIVEATSEPRGARGRRAGGGRKPDTAAVGAVRRARRGRPHTRSRPATVGTSAPLAADAGGHRVVGGTGAAEQ